MKAVAVTAPGTIEIVNLPMPEYGDYECLVKVMTCGVCNGTDLKIVNNRTADFKVEFPAILGHEGAGIVIEKGKKVKNFEIGDHVLNPGYKMPPGLPYKPMFGGMVQYGTVLDIEQMIQDGEIPTFKFGEVAIPIRPEMYPGRKLPKEISMEDAGVLLTLKENYSALSNLGLKPGDDLLIYGDGPVGLGLANFARIKKAGWIGLVGHREQRMDRIRKFSKPDLLINSHNDSVQEKVEGRRFDLVIDAVGKTGIIKEAAKMLKPGGKVGCYGVLTKGDTTIDLIGELPNNVCLHILNLPYREHDVQDEIVEMIMKGQVNPKGSYSHVMPMDDAAKAIEMTETREAFKVVLKMH